MPKELEARFLGIDPNTIRTKLAEAGFIQVHPLSRLTRRIYNLNTLDRWIRIRTEADGQTTMTFKHVTDQTSITGTEEVEIDLKSSLEEAGAFLACIGIEKFCTQENDRECWKQGEIQVTIDLWPGMRPLVEVEGPDEASVHTTTATLGLRMEDAKYGSVGNSYEIELGITPLQLLSIQHLTFAEGSKEIALLQAENAKTKSKKS